MSDADDKEKSKESPAKKAAVKVIGKAIFRAQSKPEKSQVTSESGADREPSKALWKEKKKSILTLARGVVRAIDRAGYQVVPKPGEVSDPKARRMAKRKAREEKVAAG